MASAADRDEFASMKPATVSVFQYDQVAFALKDPEIIPLPGMALTLGSNAELWKNAMMRRTDQELPLVSVCFVKDGFTRHILTFPDSTDNMVLMVNNKRLTPEAMVDGFILTGGELVKVYCTHWLRNGEVVDERVGPLTFQYRSAEKHGEEPDPEHPEPEKSLDELRPEVLRLIFTRLPVDEVLYNIPAVSSKFLDAIRDKMAFKHCEITNGWLTPQEATFFHGWRANPVTHLILRQVQLGSVKEAKGFCRFLGTGMEPANGSVVSLEVNLVTCPGTLEDEQNALDEEIFRNLGNQLKPYQALEHLKIMGYPDLCDASSLVMGPLPNLESLWTSFRGYGGDVQTIPGNISQLVRNLKMVTFKVEVENELVPFGELVEALEPPPTARSYYLAEEESLRRVEDLRRQYRPGVPPDDLLVEVPGVPLCNFDTAFRMYTSYRRCQNSQNPKRVLILDIKGDCWTTVHFIMTRMNWLDALSVTFDSPMSDDHMQILIESFPADLRFLHLVTVTPFNDRQCLAVASHLPELEILSCTNAAGLTKNCLEPLAVSCKKLRGLLFYKQEDGVFVPREDILGRKFVENLKDVEKELKAMFD